MLINGFNTHLANRASSMTLGRRNDFSNVFGRRPSRQWVDVTPGRVAAGREIVPYRGPNSIVPVRGPGISGGGVSGGGGLQLPKNMGRYIGGGALGLFALSQGRRAMDSMRNGDISNTMVSGAMAASAGWAAHDLLMGRGQMVNALTKGSQMLKLNARAGNFVNRVISHLG